MGDASETVAMDLETMKRLKTALAGRAAVDIGHFQWINLDMVKAEAGEQWDTLRKKIYTAAGHFIEKRLNENDVLVRCQGGFILVYADITGEDAKARTEALSQELNLFFLGDRILKRLEVSSKSQTVSMAELADMVAGKPPAKSEDPPAAPPRRKQAPDPPPRKRDDGVGRWQRLEYEMSRSDVTFTDIEAGEPEEAAFLNLSGGDPGIFSDVADDAFGSGADMFADLDKAWDDIVFLPSWDRRFGYITTSFCMARRQYRGKTLFGRDTLLGNDSPALHRLLDHSVAIAAQRGFLRRYADGVKCAVAIPVHYDTIIGVSDRVRYFSILQCVPQKVRKYFYLRVDNIPEGAPMGQMEELFRAMRCFGSNILAKIPPGTINLGRFENCGISLFSTQLPAPDESGHIREGLLRRLTAQAVSIGRFGARGCLTQVATFDQLQAGLDAGYEVFTGNAIGAPMDTPMPLEPCLLEDLRERSRDAA